MIIKHKARKPIATGKPTNPFIAPEGVGGFGHSYCVGFNIGAHKVIMTRDDFNALYTSITNMANAAVPMSRREDGFTYASGRDSYDRTGQ